MEQEYESINAAGQQACINTPGLASCTGADPGLFSILMMVCDSLSTFDSAGGGHQTNTERGRRPRGSARIMRTEKAD